MSKQITNLRSKLEAGEQLVGVGIHPSPMMAKLVERQDFDFASVQSVQYAQHYALPDSDVSPDIQVQDLFDISRATDLPTLVDFESGFGSVHRARRYIREFERAGAAMIHIDDDQRTSGYWNCPDKVEVAREVGVEYLSAEVVANRIRHIREASEADIIITARTKFAKERLPENRDEIDDELFQREIQRLQKYKEAGADVLWPPKSAVFSVEGLERARAALDGPMFAQVHTPNYFEDHPKVQGLLTFDELQEIGYDVVNFPHLPSVAYRAFEAALEEIMREDTVEGLGDRLMEMGELWELVGQNEAIELEREELALK